ncbi:MAG TPA: hypothetical protein VGC41_05015, partial [Kofleriaceae bacterium]
MVFLDGHGLDVPDNRGQPIIDNTFLVVFHANPEPRQIKLPGPEWGPKWRRVMDTERGFSTTEEKLDAGTTVDMPGRSLAVFQQEAT